ncbi:MAG: cation transporter [Alphaproteobacteria bacterium]|nr:cation transporter [Alphaproteobacteria bacterium]
MAAGSLSLVAFGADSVIELASAGVLLWRLRVELLHGEEFSKAIERQASRAAAALLIALTAYVAASAGYGFWRRQGQEFSIAGFGVAAAAVPTMYFLAMEKRRIAEQIDSFALRADKAESVACCYLSTAVVAGLLAQLLFGAWWIDGATSIVIIGFLLKEGREAWSAEDPCDDQD